MSNMREDIRVLIEDALLEFNNTDFESIEEVHELVGFMRGTLWSIQEMVEK